MARKCLGEKGLFELFFRGAVLGEGCPGVLELERVPGRFLNFERHFFRQPMSRLALSQRSIHSVRESVVLAIDFHPEIPSRDWAANLSRAQFVEIVKLTVILAWVSTGSAPR